jgi:hypothetical protein
MAGATEKPKLGNVTVATVKRREQALDISAKLETAGIKSLLVDERGASVKGMKVRVGGINVQVDRGDVGRALEILQQKGAPAAAAAQRQPVAHRGFQLPFRLDGRIGVAIQILALLGVAVLLARLFFF